MIIRTISGIALSMLLMLNIQSDPPPNTQTSAPAQEVQNAEYKAAQEWIKFEPSDPNSKYHRIQRVRVIVVPEEFRSQAIALLKAESVIPINAEQQEELTGTKAVSGDEILDRTIADAEAESKLPLGQPASISIADARTLYGKLHPYLVRGVAVNPHSKIFAVGWCGHDASDLCVFSGGLGRPYFERQPLIVFLEAKPNNVWISVGSAE